MSFPLEFGCIINPLSSQSIWVNLKTSFNQMFVLEYWDETRQIVKYFWIVIATQIIHQYLPHINIIYGISIKILTQNLNF